MSRTPLPPPKKKNKRSILAPLTFPNVKNPPLLPKKKRSILAPLTFPNVKNPPPLQKKKTVDFGTFDLPECQEQRRQAQKHKKVLDIREGRRCRNRPFFFGRRGGGFLTLGKVNGAKIDLFFFFFGKKKAQRKIGAKIGGGGGVQI